MLQAYIDDSGSGTQPVYVLAGFVAPTESWAAFSHDWKAILEMRPVPLEYFKMKEAAACEGQFYGWSDERRDERVNQLIAVVKEHAMFGIYSVVHHDIFNHIFKGKIARGMDNPYFFAYYGIMQRLIRHQVLYGIAGKADFIFDQELVTLKKREAWDLFIRFAPPQARDFIGSPPIERDDKEVLPLQAADLLAWKIRRAWDDKYVQNRIPHWPWDSLDPIEMITEGWDSKRLKAMHERLQEMKRNTGLEFPYDS